DDLAGHGADIGAPVTADFRFVSHAAERHADIFAARGLGDRLRERGLADTRRADEAQDRAFHLARALLHRQVLKDAFLDLLQTVVVVRQDLFGVRDVLLDLALLAPRQ